MDRPIFDRDGSRVRATTLARGPWDENACHGGAPAALLAAAVDQVPSLAPMQIVRLTFELLRPVPLARSLELRTQIVREGKRIQAVDAQLTDGDVEVMRVRSLRQRITALDLPHDRPTPQPAPSPAPDDLERFGGLPGWADEGFWTAVDVRFVRGALGRPGHGTAWFQVLAPLADGVPLTPAARAAAAGDFGNGIGPPLPMGPYRYLNPDLTVDLHRLPDGPWVGLDASSVADVSGSGLTTSTLFDTRGAIGAALQSLFIDAD